MRKTLLLIFLIPCLLNALILEKEVHLALDSIGIEELRKAATCNDELLDVAIIGAGQAGLCVSLALQKQDIFNFALFDSAPDGLEGQWMNTARMHHLQSDKNQHSSVAQGTSELSFKTWYQAQYGDWDALAKIPTDIWAEYLQWFKHVLNLNVKNNCRLNKIVPHEDSTFTLVFNDGIEVRAKKIVLATGRGGFGGYEVPECIKQIPREKYYHSAERINPAVFKGKRVTIIGAAASAYDLAGTALESGAVEVDMLMRREKAPVKTVFAFDYFWPSYNSLTPEERFQFISHAWDCGWPPPKESRERIAHYPNFKLLENTRVNCVEFNDKVLVHTNKGIHEADILVLGTGYAINVENVPEVASFADQIMLWKDKGIAPTKKLGRFPFLGDSLEFMERNPGGAPYLKNIYCYNYGAFLSHGAISGDVQHLNFGADRVARKIANDLHLPPFYDLIANSAEQDCKRDETEGPCCE